MHVPLVHLSTVALSGWPWCAVAAKHLAAALLLLLQLLYLGTR